MSERERERETYTFFCSDWDDISAPNVCVPHGVDNFFRKNTGKTRLDILAVLLVVGTPGHIVS